MFYVIEWVLYLKLKTMNAWLRMMGVRRRAVICWERSHLLWRYNWSLQMPLLFHGNQIYFCSWPCGETGMLFMDSLLTVYQLLDGNIFHSSESFFTQWCLLQELLHHCIANNYPLSSFTFFIWSTSRRWLFSWRSASQSIFEFWSSSCATADSRTDSKPGRCRIACPWSYKLSNSRIFSTKLKRTSQIPLLVVDQLNSCMTRNIQVSDRLRGRNRKVVVVDCCQTWRATCKGFDLFA